MLCHTCQFPVNKAVTCEDIKAKWDVICRFDENATNPTTTSDSLETVSRSLSYPHLSGSDRDSPADHGQLWKRGCPHLPLRRL